MKNLRILFAGSGGLAISSGDVLSADCLATAGFDAATLLSRGDAEETDDDATVTFDPPGPTADELAAAAVAAEAAADLAEKAEAEATAIAEAANEAAAAAEAAAKAAAAGA